VLQSDEAIYYIDQHALAERIAFEKMKRNIADKTGLKSEVVLQPITVEMHSIPNIQDKIDQLNAL